MPSSVLPVALLPELYLPPSGFLVSPVLAYWREPGAVRPVDPAETAVVARVPVAELVDPANRGQVHHSERLHRSGLPGGRPAGLGIHRRPGRCAARARRLGGALGPEPGLRTADAAMNIVDIVVVLLVIAAAISGFRQGLITAMFTLVTAIAGAIAAIRLAPLLMELVDDSTAKIAIGIACVVVGVGIGEVAGSTVGKAISNKVSWRPAQAVDRTLGLFGYSIAVLIVIWLIAVPLASVPVPWLSSAIRGSAVLGKVDEVMPSQAQDVSSRLREVFNDSGFPAILDPLAPTPNTSVDPPDPTVAGTAGVAAAEQSILKVRAVAESCARRMEGTGFVIGAGKVMTNAHVVAGSDRAVVETDQGSLEGTVVLYDANETWPSSTSRS